MYYDVFISHNEETELDFAIRIKEKLWDKRKIKVFVAKKDIPPDTNDWDKFTTDAIKNSASVLVLYDDGAVNSPTVKGEIVKAQHLKRKIIVFKEKKVERTDIPVNIVASQHQSFDIKNPEDLINQVLEMRWQKNPNTEPEFHDLYEEANRYELLNSSLVSDIFLEDIKNKLAYTFEYRLHERLPNTIKYYTELKDLVNKMLEDGEIEKTEEYVVLERREGTKKALHILSVGIWKEGIHKGIL